MVVLHLKSALIVTATQSFLNACTLRIRGLSLAFSTFKRPSEGCAVRFPQHFIQRLGRKPFQAIQSTQSERTTCRCIPSRTRIRTAIRTILPGIAGRKAESATFFGFLGVCVRRAKSILL
ncbi:hypothetical protein VNO77_11536 [Canavalia gladiata]|uniref:Uncharacterized protein n=1 Tax=Canavalia gladiata TaxID=3824 RepID=A0AAN9MH54_CANGL